MGAPASHAPPATSMRLPESRATADRGTDDRGTGTSDAAAQARAEARERSRRDYLDGMRAALTIRLTKEELAKDDVFILLDRLNGALNSFQDAPGPRSEYASAVNLLALYMELAQRADVAERDGDHALMMRDYRQLPVPWTKDRAKRIDDVRGLDAASVARYNAVVAQGPPVDDEPAPARGGRAMGKQSSPALAPAAGPRSGIQHQGDVALPFGMRGVIHPGGADARIIYTILKTPEMNTTSEDGRIAILEAVIARILAPKYDEAYAPVAAQALVKAAHEGLSSAADVVKSAEPGAFEKRKPNTEFTFEVGLNFLLQLDQVTDGAVPMELINQLDPHVEVKTDDPKPLWEEIWPRATLKERAYWLQKRALGAREQYARDRQNFPLMPGHFYVDRGMTFVAYGDVAGDQIWCTRDLRIWKVNERALLIEAFRKGVLDAAGGVALAYVLVAVSLILIDGPEMLTMLGRLRFPMQFAREFLQLLSTRPLMVLGRLAIDQGANIILSGGWDNYVDSLGEPMGWFNLLFSVLGATNTKLEFAGGAHIDVTPGEPGKFEFTVTEGAKAEGAAVETQPFPDGEAAPVAPAADKPSPKAAPSPPDEGAQVVLRDQPGTAATESQTAAAKETGARDLGSAPAATPRDETPLPRNEIAERYAARDKARGTAARGKDEKGTADKVTETPKAAANDNAPRVANDNVAEAAVSDQAVMNAADAHAQELPLAGGAEGGALGTQASGRSSRAGDGGGVKGKAAPAKKGGAATTPAKKGTSNTGLGAAARGTGAKTAPGPARSATRLVDGQIRFTRKGVEFRFSTEGASAERFNAIPPGDTVVYTFHDADGNVVYSGITTKQELDGKFRDALSRAREHMRDKPGDFVGGVSEFRIRGHYETEREAAALEFSLIRDSEAGTQTVFNRDLDTWDTYTRGERSNLKRGWRNADLEEGADTDMGIGYEAPDERPVPDVEANIPKEMTRPIRFRIDDPDL